MINSYSFFYLLTAFISAVLGIFVFSRNIKNPVNRTWCNLGFAVSLWSLGFGMTLFSRVKSEAVFWGNLSQTGASLIPVTYLHFILYLTANLERRKKILYSLYILAFLFALSSFTPLLIKDYVPKQHFNYYFQPGMLYLYFTISFFAIMTYAFVELIRGIKKADGYLKNQLMYVLAASLIGFGSGATTFPLVFNLQLYPFGGLVFIYNIIITIAILKYRLLDIKLALTRAGIFVFVYFPIVFVPFWLGPKFIHTDFWWIPIFLMGILATLGIFIYQYLNKKAEDVILKDQKSYQKAIRENSSKMLLIKDLDRLLNTAGSAIIEAIKVSCVGIYLEDEKAKKYTARYKQARVGECGLPEKFTPESELVYHLSANKAPIIGEEVAGSKHKIGLAVPLLIGDTLLGFLLLGDKPEGRVYTQDDVDIFTIMANQISLAIENCQFYQRERENQAMFYQSATLADMGVMADSMGHQIKNHIQKMSALAGGNAGMIEEALKKEMTLEEALAYLKRIAGVLLKIEGQGETGGRLIESISQFSRLPSESFRDISFKEIADRATDIAQYKVKFDEIDYSVIIAPDIPILYAHPILIEALFNLIDNAYDATRQKLAKLRKSQEAVSYKGSVTVSASAKDSQLEIQVKDNGIGIKKENSHRLFIPYFTTKATSIKGKGLGLFVIKRIVENHEGTIRIDSEYMQGTTFIITIPIRVKQEEKKELKQEEEEE